MLPAIFRRNMLDDFMRMPTFDFGFPAMERFDKLMKTDLKETDNGYELSVDLPGFKKDEIELQLQNGYLQIRANKNENKEEKDDKGRIIHQERYVGAMSRSFYVGDTITEEDVKATFENGVLQLDFPKEAPKELPAKKFIQITDGSEKAE